MTHRHGWLMICGLFLSITGCSSLDGGKPTSRLVQCDAYSQLGHEYFIEHQEIFSGLPLTSARIDLFQQPGVLSRLSLSKHHRNRLVPQRQFQVAVPESSPDLGIIYKYNDYVAIFIPPETAGAHLGQRSGDNAEPAFLLVPRAAFYKGQCHEGVAPILLGPVQSLNGADIPQLLIGSGELKSLAASLYMDPRSDSLDELITHYGENWINQSVWRGWVDVSVRARHRGWWRKFWNRVSGSNLGAEGSLNGTAISFGHSIQPPPMAVLSAEYDDLEAGWKRQIELFAQVVQEITAKLNQLHGILDRRPVDPAQFQTGTENALQVIERQGELLEQFRDQMAREQGLSITTTELDYLSDLFQRKLDSLHSQYLDLVSHYADAVAIKPGQSIDPQIILNPIPVTVAGSVVNPVRRPAVAIPLAKFGGGFTVDGAAYLDPAKQPDGAVLYKVKLSALANLTHNLNAMKQQLSSEIRAAQRCSLRVRFINLDIPEVVDGESFTKPIDVGVTVRACTTVNVPYPCPEWDQPFKWCNKQQRMVTNLYDTTARGELKLIIERSGKDFAIRYRYHLCAHGWICTSGDGRSPAVMSSLKQSPKLKEFIESGRISQPAVFLTKARNGDAYFAVQVESVPVDGPTAIFALRALDEKLP